jgi:hypothetical protein
MENKTGNNTKKGKKTGKTFVSSNPALQDRISKKVVLATAIKSLTIDV